MLNDEAYLMDILESAKIAVNYLKDISLEKFEKDLKTQDAVIRRLEIIGEASSKVSDETQNNYSEVSWKKMKGMRNLLIHNYNYIDIGIIWETVKNNLPPLIKELERITKY
ncbi:MAG: DUF86 domain-containing protein [Bacteroidetes bacterium]|nr:DUF86 domain-containing protein [Bacteroidota bacterium]